MDSEVKRQRKLYTEDRMNPLIEQLVSARTAQKLSQDELNNVIGYTNRLVGRWECGDRTPSAFALFNWADALGLEIKLQPKT